MKGAEEVAVYFAANLRRARKAAGISQEEAGRRSSLHRTEVGLLERGARVPRIDTLVKLASAMDVPPDRLLEGISWTPGEIGEAKPGKFQHNPNPDPSQASQPTASSRRSETEDSGEGSEEL
jgi:transcriptional regulator with XRE-family HTH domain